MKHKNISKELKCKIKVVAKKTTGARAMTAQCTDRNEALVTVWY